MMKATLPGALLVCMITAYGQEAETPLSRMVFKLSPQHFIHNSLKAGIEHFNDKHSSSAAFFVTGMIENKEYTLEGDGYSGLAGEVQLRKYISPMKGYTSRQGRAYHQGVYGAAYLQGGYYSGDFKDAYSYYDPNTGGMVTQYNYDYTEKVINGGFGFTIGYQKTLWQAIFLEAFVGGGVQFADKTRSGVSPNADYYYYEGVTDPGYKGILPKIGLNMGIGL